MDLRKTRRIGSRGPRDREAGQSHEGPRHGLGPHLAPAAYHAQFVAVGDRWRQSRIDDRKSIGGNKPVRDRRPVLRFSPVRRPDLALNLAVGEATAARHRSTKGDIVKMDIRNTRRVAGTVRPDHLRRRGRHEINVVHRIIVGLDPVGAHDARTQTDFVHVAIETAPFLISRAGIRIGVNILRRATDTDVGMLIQVYRHFKILGFNKSAVDVEVIRRRAPVRCILPNDIHLFPCARIAGLLGQSSSHTIARQHTIVVGALPENTTGENTDF